MTQELLNKQLSEISNSDLIKKCRNQVRDLARTGGRSHKMSVPVNKDDTDIILSELIDRYEKILNK